MLASSGGPDYPLKVYRGAETVLATNLTNAILQDAFPKKSVLLFRQDQRIEAASLHHQRQLGTSLYQAESQSRTKDENVLTARMLGQTFQDQRT